MVAATVLAAVVALVAFLAGIVVPKPSWYRLGAGRSPIRLPLTSLL